MAKINANIDELSKLIKFLKDADKYKLRVGILGNQAEAQHEGTSLTNAELGAVHEFGADIKHPGGTPYKILENGKAQFVNKKDGSGLPITKAHSIKIPQRSFLEKPLKAKMPEKIKEMKKDIFKQIFLRRSITQFYNRLAGIALEIVQNSWAKGGDPQWKSLTSATRRHKAKAGFSPNILTQTGQLGSSISAKVIKND